MDLLTMYPNTKNKLFQFVANKPEDGASTYIIEIYKWSDTQKKHMFENWLSQETFTDINSEPDMFFDDILNNLEGGNSSKKENSLDKILLTNNIKADSMSTTSRSNSTNSRLRYINVIFFKSEAEAKRCANLMSKLFKYVSP